MNHSTTWRWPWLQVGATQRRALSLLWGRTQRLMATFRWPNEARGRELLLSASLSHPHILTLKQKGTSRHSPWEDGWREGLRPELNFTSTLRKGAILIHIADIRLRDKWWHLFWWWYRWYSLSVSKWIVWKQTYFTFYVVIIACYEITGLGFVLIIS